MSTSGFQSIAISTPTTPVTSSNSLENSSSDHDTVSAQDRSVNQLTTHMLLKRDNSPDVSSPGYIVEQSHNQPQTISQNIDADYNSNSFNFSYDGSFSLSPQQSIDMKDLEKSDATSVILSGQSSLSAGSNASPKSTFMALSINETKNDKMISGFDGRVDGLSPLSVIAVSAYQDGGHPSPNISSGMLSRGHALRYHPGSDTMLSALNYTESDMLQEGGFDVPSSHTFSTLDGLLGTTSAPGMRLPDLLDGDINQEAYIEAGQDLQLSPQTFPSSNDTFTVRENSPLTGLSDNTIIKTDVKNKGNENITATLIVDKLKVKTRPVKATSPNRPGTQPCPTCGKVFSNSSALTKHKLTHSDERKYVCQLCAKAFKRQDHLNGHMLTHRNKKPFECDAEGCGKSYCDARSLRRHKENHHSTTSTNLSTSLSNQVSVIPGLAHLGFNVQTSFPASVITSSSGPGFTETSLANRIQYAPPPTTVSLSNRASPANTESTSRTVTSSVVSSVIPTATSHLQFLTFQQQSKSQQQSTSSSPKTKSENGTVLSSWQPQTINTGALLLTQNFGASQSLSQSQSALVARSFEVSSSEQGNSSGSELSQSQLLSLKHDPKKPDITSQDSREQISLEEAVLSEACFEVVNSSNGAKQIVALTPQGSMNLQFESASGTVVRIQEGESLYSRPSMQIVKIEASDQSNTGSSVPTTPTIKETPDGSQIESPLLQQLLNQQQNDINGTGINNSRSEQSFLSSLQEQQKQTTSTQQSSVLVTSWSQVPFAGTNSTSSRFSNQDPKPVECSLCQRKFKNVPALNGHMRLHGGYFKKENEAKKNDKKITSASHQPPLQTASTNVRALIEEKIIQKRNFLPQQSSGQNQMVAPNPPPQTQTFDFQITQMSNQQQNSNSITQASPVLSPVTQETSVFNNFPTSSQASDLNSLTDSLNLQTCDILKKLNLKEPFRVPHPPIEKHRRHSDSDHFIIPKRPCTTFTTSALTDLLRNRVVAKRTCRTGSDPGEPLNMDTSFSDFADSLSSINVNDLSKFHSLETSSLSSAMDDAATELHHHNLTAITPEGAALPVLSAEDIPEAQPMIMSMRDIAELDTQCLERNVFFDGTNNDMGVSQSFPEISVSELEIMQLASVVTSSSSLPTEGKPVNGGKIRIGEDSNDDDVFLSPTSLPTSPMKGKKKRRPEPLYIPPYVNTSGYTSRLRSPRLWDPSNPDHKKLSPPPYTPPPMLSPVRSGSGLFWHILSGSGSLTPKSAPITPSFGLSHKVSIGETTPEDDDFIEAPESDILPHVNIGSNYQAKIPPFNPNFKDALLVKHKADKVWDPSTMDSLTEEEVEAYLDLSCSAAVPGGGRNKEYALHLLHMCKGKIKDAALSLMDIGPKLSTSHPLLTFQYSENDRWSPEEIEAYHQGLLKCDKDFFSIAKDIPTKTVKQCIQFYYLWKKVCPDEYKRIRLIRRRKEQESLYYNLRSKEENQENEEKSVKQSGSSPTSANRRNNEELSDKTVTVNGTISTTKSTEVNFTTTTSSFSTSYNGSGVSSTYDFTPEPLEEFPCKICGKVFNKVKSRSAHMKSHRQPDSDKKNKYES